MISSNSVFTRRSRAWLLAGVLGGCTISAAAPALAQDVAAAANAFSRAQKAELSGDYASAAELYELADSLAPAPEALRSALKARKAAGQLDAAAIHAEELLSRYADDKRSKELADATLTEAKEKLIRYEVRCQPRACGVVVDGAAAGIEAKEQHVIYLEPGQHEVSATFGSAQTEPQSVEGEAGAEGSLTFDAPPEAERQRVAPDGTVISGPGGVGDAGAQGGGLPPWVFVTGAVVTAGLGAVTVWSGLDVMKAHDDYEGRETLEAYKEGQDKERRTNVLIAATAVSGITTGVLAILTDWSGKPDRKVAKAGARLLGAAPVWVPGGGFMNVEGRF
jgi:hypothetical protein